MSVIPKTIVLKFGGTSVASAEAIGSIAAIVSRLRARRPVVVVSAVRSVTEMLLALSRASHKEIPNRIHAIRNIHCELIRELLSESARREEAREYVDEQLKKIEEVMRRGKLSLADSDELVSYGEIISSFIVALALRAHGIETQQVIATDIIATDDRFGHAEFLPEKTGRNAQHVLVPLLKCGIVPPRRL